MENKYQFYKSLGAKIKAYRKAKNWSQSRLAEKSCLTQGYISEIEAGKARVTVDTLVDISDAFGVTPNTLLEKQEVYIDPTLAIALYRMDSKAQKKLYETYKLITSK